MKFCFAVVAHVDSGKTTLCRALAKHFLKTDLELDNLTVEKNRGITVKLKQFAFFYKQNEYIFIDTPGHEEFFSEVERSIDMVDNILLLIDSRKGVQSQTYKIAQLLSKLNKFVIVVFNKVDLLEDLSILDSYEQKLKDSGLVFNSVKVSAKKLDMQNLYDEFENMKPLEKENNLGKIFDIQFSNFGFYCFLKTNIKLSKGDSIILSSGLQVKIIKIFYRRNALIEIESLTAPDIGIILVKSNQPDLMLTGEFFFEKPIVKIIETFSLMFFQVYPKDNETDFHKIMNKIFISDPSVEKRHTSSEIFGNGYLVGVKGKVHMEVFLQRINTEFNSEVLVTNPSFVFRTKINEELFYLKSLEDFENIKSVKKIQIEELYFSFNLEIPHETFSLVTSFLNQRRLIINSLKTDGANGSVFFNIPISEMNNDFLANLKSFSKGYYKLSKIDENWQISDVVPFHITINGDILPGMSRLINRNQALTIAKPMTEVVANYLSKRNFDIKVQAILGSKSIHTTIKKARPNNVAGKCYGGDITRKKKLWQNQKLGRLKQQSSFKQKITTNDFKQMFLELDNVCF